MLGPLDAQPKERKVSVRQKRGPLGELTRPDELDGIEELEKQETDRNMEIMWGIISRDPSQVGGAPNPRNLLGMLCLDCTARHCVSLVARAPSARGRCRADVVDQGVGSAGSGPNW